MYVLSEGGLAVSSIVWQSSSGAWALSAVCKLTFQLEPGVATVAAQQEAINEDDAYWNDDDSRSLVASTDLAPFKPRADVVIVGHAFAPEGRSVGSLIVRVCVSDIDKSIEICRDRSFKPDGRIREGAPFSKMPLRYERAAGGPDQRNPVGIAFDAPPDTHGCVAIPNLQPLGTFVQWKGDRFDTIGLGPIAPSWPDRMDRLRRHASRWSHRDWQTRPLPADIDIAYFNVAPRDQQASRIRPDERLQLEHLHPSHARLVTSLPGIVPRAAVERASGHREQMELVADTLWIDTDRSICTLTWRGRMGLVHASEEGQVRIWAEGVELRREQPTIRTPDPAMLASLASPPAPLDRSTDATTTLLAGLESSPATALPFESSPWRTSPLASSGASKPAEPLGGDGGATMFLSPLTPNVHDSLPFASAPEMPRNPADPHAPLPPATSSIARAPCASAFPAELAPFTSLTGAPPVPSRAALEQAEGAPLVALDAPTSSPVETPAPPPMVGPLATPAMTLERQTREQPRVTALLPPTEVPGLTPEIEAPPLPLDDISLPRCAALDASIARCPHQTGEILRAAALDPATWSRIKAHYSATIRRETKRGKSALLKTYDAAYVAQLEKERGPITVEEFVRLSVATERGESREALESLGIPNVEPIRIQRIWILKTASDPALGANMREVERRTRGAA